MTATATRPERTPDSGEFENLRTENQLGLVRLASFVLLIAGVSILFNKGGAALIFVAVISMIMLHEFGHYITAKWAGMKVTDFFVGFGPALWSIQRGETRWGVRALPIGGYVRVIGMHNLEEVAPEDEHRTYRSKRYWQRLRFAMAGSVTHFVVALVLMAIVLGGFGRVVEFVPTTTLERVGARFEDGTPTPAHAAGIREGDKIVAIDGVAIRDWDEVSEAIVASKGRQLSVTVERSGDPLTFDVTPTMQPDRTGELAPKIGVQAGERTITDKEPWPSAIWQAPGEIQSMTVESAKALAGLFTRSNIEHQAKQITGSTSGDPDPQKDGNRLLSMLGLFRLADDLSRAGMAAVLMLLISLNVFIGIFNMIPLLPFDGGHVAIATYEAIASKIKGRRHRVDMNKMLPVAYTVVFLLALLSLSALWLDIVHPFDLG